MPKFTGIPRTQESPRREVYEQGRIQNQVETFCKRVIKLSNEQAPQMNKHILKLSFRNVWSVLIINHHQKYENTKECDWGQCSTGFFTNRQTLSPKHIPSSYFSWIVHQILDLVWFFFFGCLFFLRIILICL